MLRVLLVCTLAAVAWAVDAQAVWAADGSTNLWPSTGTFTRDTGFYVSPWKVLAYWLVFLLWVRTTDWVSQDTQALSLRWAVWIPVVFFTFFVALLLFWIIPNFWVGIVLLLVAYAAPLGVYIRYRNQQVKSSYDKIFSAKHTRRWIARKMNAIGIKMEGADIDPRDLGPDIKYTPMGAGNERDDNVNLLNARQSPGYMPSRELLDDALRQRATHVMLDYTPQAVGVRYQVDGVWHDRSSLERVQGDPILEIYKGIAGLNAKERRAKQAGQFGVEAAKKKLTCKIVSQGTQAGERVMLQFEQAKIVTLSLEELGMRQKMQERLFEIIGQPGLFVFSSMPGGGLTTTIDQVLSNVDRFTRAFNEVVDSDKPHRDIENVHPTLFSSAAGETALSVLPKLIREYPDVIIVRDVADAETLAVLCEQAGEDRLTITSVRAKEAVEALARLLLLKIPPAELAQAVTGVLNVRLIRKLCEKCREAYPPPAKVLQQLGLPAGRIEALYRTPTQPIDPKHPEVVCDQCNGVGYLGRTAIFELLEVDDAIRKMLVTAPKVENLRSVARKAKHRGLQEEGVLLVAKGVTSLQELLRVLKQ
jgi:type II secretory ATPase GspE/PulE/Tfp pilus assembly ATPase PilB-like protein